MQNNLTQVQQQLEDAKTEGAKRQTQFETQTGELTQLKTQHEEATQQLKTLEESKTALEAEVAARQSELTEVKANLTQTQQQLEATKTESAQWQTQHTQATESLSAMRTALTALQTKVDIAQQKENQQQTQQERASAHLQMLSDQATTQLQSVVEPDGLTVEPQADRVMIRMQSSNMFERGGAALWAEGHQALDRLAVILQEFPDHTVRIEGHTDNVPIGGQNRVVWPTNWELSTARAASAARYLETKGVASERLSIGGFSLYKPLTTNKTPEGRAQNRRLEISLWPAGR